MKHSTDKAQAGIARIAMIILIIAAVVGIIAGISFLTRSKNPSDQNSTDGQALNERNVSRKNDAGSLLASTTEFMTKNNGSLPTEYVGGVLAGDPGTKLTGVTLEIYKSLTVAQGEQTGVTSDELRLVTGATCGNEGATEEVDTTDAVAAQYTQEKSDGSFTAECQEV